MVTYRELSPADRLHLISNLQWDPLQRKAAITNRLAIMRESFVPLVHQRLEQVYNNPEIAREVGRFATPIFNCLKRFAARIAVSYKYGVRRPLRDQSEDVNEKWRKQLAATKISVHAKEWDRRAWACNTMFVIPAPYVDATGKPQIRFDEVYGDRADVIMPADGDPYGLPDVLAYAIRPLNSYFDAETKPTADYAVVLDADAWHTVNVRGEILRSTEHGLGFFPGSLLRNTLPTNDDYWDGTSGAAVASLAIEAGMIMATASWIRKAQNRKLLALFIDNDELLGGMQGAHPERALVVPASPGDVQMSISDFETSIKMFEEHYKALLNEVAEVYGVPSTLIDPDASAGSAANVFATASTAQYSALHEVRQDAILLRIPFDLDLQYKIAAVARRFGVPDAVDPEVVLEHATADFPPLPFLESPSQRLTTYITRTEFGVANQIDFVQEEHPDWSREQAAEFIRERINERNEFHELLAIRNMAADPTAPVLEEGQTAAQQQGRQGGNAAAQNGAQGPSARGKQKPGQGA